MMLSEDQTRIRTYLECRKGLISREEAKEYLKEKKELVVFSFMDPIDYRRQFFFYSDHHGMNFEKHFPDDFQELQAVFVRWIPVSTFIPFQVMPREKLPSGVIETVEDYEAVFYEGAQYIENKEELLKICRSIKAEHPQLEIE